MARKILLIDDGSTDATSGELVQITNSRADCRIICFPENRGQAAALLTSVGSPFMMFSSATAHTFHVMSDAVRAATKLRSAFKALTYMFAVTVQVAVSLRQSADATLLSRRTWRWRSFSWAASRM